MTTQAYPIVAHQISDLIYSMLRDAGAHVPDEVVITVIGAGDLVIVCWKVRTNSICIVGQTIPEEWDFEDTAGITAMISHCVREVVVRVGAYFAIQELSSPSPSKIIGVNGRR
jgi:hypothetical protein